MTRSSRAAPSVNYTLSVQLFSRQKTRSPKFTALKKSNNLFLCSFSTLNKSYRTFPDQNQERGRGRGTGGNRSLDMQKNPFALPFCTLRGWRWRRCCPAPKRLQEAPVVGWLVGWKGPRYIVFVWPTNWFLGEGVYDCNTQCKDGRRRPGWRQKSGVVIVRMSHLDVQDLTSANTELACQVKSYFQTHRQRESWVKLCDTESRGYKVILMTKPFQSVVVV